MILHGDCRLQLATLPDASVDAIVTDPPYGISFMGHDWDRPTPGSSHVCDNCGNDEPAETWNQCTDCLENGAPATKRIRPQAPMLGQISSNWHEKATHSRGYADNDNRAFQAWCLEWASECLRVLKPGGHLLAFGGTRTYHRMTCAIEDAGFEIRDSLHWLYGSGFPKSLDVSKAIDKAAGATRPIVGPTRPGAQSIATNAYGAWGDGITPTVAATPAAAAADGWGTALKPAHEPIVLARKPLTGTVAANVMEYGTGALNIDATRVGFTSESDKQQMTAGVDAIRERGGVMSNSWKNSSDLSGANPVSERGRWPANIILTHSPKCEQTGTTDVPATSGVPQDQLLNGISGAGRTHSRNGDQWTPTFGNGDGTETVATWNCAPGCPVATLNEQSGNRPGVSSNSTGATTAFTTPKSLGTVAGYADSGGASRFFTTTEWDPEIDVPFLYVAKPSRKERNAGLDGMPTGHTDFGGNGRPGAGFNEVVHGKAPTAAANFHPTVKPVTLIRHLIRLVTPPGGTVLDPFLGSGTTAVAAILEGFDWIGCELTDDYVPIIEARVAWANGQSPTSSAAPTEPTLTLFGEDL